MGGVGVMIESIYHSSYCLWVGAGVTRHLSSIAVPCPGWVELVERLELEAQVPSSMDALDVRLSRCWLRLGLVQFQLSLRRNIHHALANAILSWSEANPGEVPLTARQIATLACGANTIVNFNIEAGTSLFMGGTVGPYSIKAYESPLITRLRGPDLWWAGGGAGPPRMSILHPHGIVETGGLCVLTRDDYVEMNGTLALQLAVHTAFRETLVIVGMSLGDEYLREQILRFRRQIGTVHWVRAESDPLDSATEAWVRNANVAILTAPTWSEVWATIDSAIVGQRRASRRRLAAGWLDAIRWACENDEIQHASPDDSPLGGLLAAARGIPPGTPPTAVANRRWHALLTAYQDALKS